MHGFLPCPTSAWQEESPNSFICQSGLVRAIIAEGLGISAGALGGLHLVLAGPSAAISSARQVRTQLLTETRGFLINEDEL